MASTPWRSRLRVAGIVLLLLCVLAGWVYSALLPTSARYPDEEEYLSFSHNLLHGPGYSMDGIHLTASRPPGYPFFLAAIEFLGGGVVAMRMVQYLIFSATIFVVWRLIPQGQRFGGLLAVTGVTMLYPVLFYTSATLYPQILSGFLFMLALALLLTERRTALTDFACGLVFGALLLAVPTFALTLIVVLAVAWWLKLIRWTNGVAILVGATLIVSTWTARNWIQFHHIVPFATNSGENLLIGNYEDTTPWGGSGHVDHTSYYQAAEDRGMDEFQRDAYLKGIAIDWIKQHPTRAFVLYLEKTANYFNVYNTYAKTTNAEASSWRQIILGGTYVVLMGLLLWRLAEVKRFPLTGTEKLFLLTYILTAFTMAIFVTRIRYRLPYDYLIITIVAMHVSRRLQLWLEPSTKST